MEAAPTSTCPHCLTELADSSLSACPTCSGDLHNVAPARIPAAWEARAAAREAERRRQRLMVIMTIVTVVAVVGLSVLRVSGIVGPTRDADGAVIIAGNLAAEDLRVGDCGVLEGTPSQQAIEIQVVRVVPCEEPHDFEMYADLLAADSTGFPGGAALAAEAQRVCESTLAAVAPVTEGITVAYAYPTAAGWEEGDRAIACLATFADGSSSSLVR